VGKLVRDKIPDLIMRSGRTPHAVVLDEDAFRTALQQKLFEEADELRLAGSAQGVVEEAADVLEVLTALVGSYGMSIDTITAAAQAKRAERGGFEMRLWLESIEPGTPR